MNIGKLGVFYFCDLMAAQPLADFARKLEKWGYGALWFPEAVGRNSLVTASWLLSNTESLVVASGIANIFARDAQAAAAGRRALDEHSGGRYLMGLGVSHPPLVEDMRGHVYDSPLQRMRNYLEKMSQAAYQAPVSDRQGELVLAALGPKMTALAGELSDGAHPYNVTPEHTARAREILGPDKKLYVEQKVLLVSDPVKARAMAKEALAFYVPMVNYQKNWDRLGFSREDYEGCSDRFLDAMVAWGDETAIRRRIEEHLAAGADHVCIQPLGEPERVLELLAPKAVGSLS